jgi:hypothetical protein
MRKSVMSLLTALVVSCSFVFAQEEPKEQPISPLQERKTILFAEPFSFIASGLQAGVERVFLPDRSIYVSLGYYLAEKYGAYNSREMEGFKAETQVRFHIPVTARQNEIVFLGPYANYRVIKLTQNVDSNDPVVPIIPINERRVTAQAAQIGVLAGYKVIFIRKFSVEAFLGGGLVIPTTDYPSDLFHLPLVNPYQKGFNIKFGFSMGYMF